MLTARHKPGKAACVASGNMWLPVTELLSFSTMMPWTHPCTSLAPLACAASMKAVVSFCGCTCAVVPTSAISCMHTLNLQTLMLILMLSGLTCTCTRSWLS